MQIQTTIQIPQTVPPERLRAAVIAGRVAVSEPVARVLAELAYGPADHDRALVLPTILGGL